MVQLGKVERYRPLECAVMDVYQNKDNCKPRVFRSEGREIG